MTKYAYSLDEERYYGSFDSIESALLDAREDAEEGACVVWVGEIVAASELLKKRAPWRVVDSIIEAADEFLVEEIGWDVQVIELTGKQLNELGELITNWLCDNASFNAHAIINAKEYPVE